MHDINPICNFKSLRQFHVANLWSRIAALKEIDSAAVVGVYHPKWDERPIAVVTLAKGQSSTALLEKASGSSNLLQHVAAERAFQLLAKYIINIRIVLVSLFSGILTFKGSWTHLHVESLGYTIAKSTRM